MSISMYRTREPGDAVGRLQEHPAAGALVAPVSPLDRENADFKTIFLVKVQESISINYPTVVGVTQEGY